MKKPDNLFLLIESLSKSERRYFVLDASSKRSNSNLVKLFEILSHQEKHNPEELHKLLKDESFTKHLPVTKQRLYETILRSMRSYNSERSINIKLSGMLADIEYLYKKRLFRQSNMMIKKGGKLALEHDKSLVIMELMEWEDKLAERLLNSQLTTGYIDKKSERFQQLLDQTKSKKQARELSLSTYNYFWVKENPQIACFTFHPLINIPVLKDRSRDVQFRIQCHYFNSRAKQFSLNGNWKKAFSCSKELAELIDSVELLNENEYQMSLAAKNNLLTRGLIIEEYEYVKEGLNSLNGFPDKYPKAKKSKKLMARWFAISEALTLQYHIAVRNLDQGMDTIAQIEKGLRKYSDKLEDYMLMHLYYSIACFYFIAGKHRESLSWINILLYDSNLEFRKGIYPAARILNLILYFELGRRELLEYLARSTYRILYKKHGKNKFEAIVISFFKKTSYLTKKEEILREFKLFKSRVTDFKNDCEKNQITTRIDLLSWIEAKMQRVPIHKLGKPDKLSRIH